MREVSRDGPRETEGPLVSRYIADDRSPSGGKLPLFLLFVGNAHLTCAILYYDDAIRNKLFGSIASVVVGLGRRRDVFCYFWLCDCIHRR